MVGDSFPAFWTVCVLMWSWFPTFTAVTFAFVHSQLQPLFGPVASITTVNVNGTDTTAFETLGLDNETIELDGGGADRVKVTYITEGLNDSLIKQAMLQLISTYYDNRANFIEGASKGIGKNVEIPTNTKVILTSYKTMFL